MKILITGASSGIGRDMARIYGAEGHEVVAVGRSQERLDKLKAEIGCETISLDVSREENCYKLFEQVGRVDVLINSAGFGDLGYFTQTSLDKDVSMMHTNVVALHILTKLYLQDMIKKNSGKILNIASIAGFMPGPQMATYYATKAYVVRLTEALAREVKEQGANVYVGALCPGPVDTRFNERANSTFGLKSVKSAYIAKYGIRKMNKGKVIILPTLTVKLARFGVRFLPDLFQAKLASGMQSKKKAR